MKTSRRLSYAVSIVAISMVAASCGGPSGQATPPRVPTTTASSSTSFVSTTIPDTEVGAQLAWFLAAVSDVPLSAQVIDAHFKPQVLEQVSSDRFNAALEE